MTKNVVWLAGVSIGVGFLMLMVTAGTLAQQDLVGEQGGEGWLYSLLSPTSEPSISASAAAQSPASALLDPQTTVLLGCVAALGVLTVSGFGAAAHLLARDEETDKEVVQTAAPSPPPAPRPGSVAGAGGASPLSTSA